jgi:hypothetical protein
VGGSVRAPLVQAHTDYPEQQRLAALEDRLVAEAGEFIGVLSLAGMSPITASAPSPEERLGS